jgi:hypothetical protein
MAQEDLGLARNVQSLALVHGTNGVSNCASRRFSVSDGFQIFALRKADSR